MIRFAKIPEANAAEPVVAEKVAIPDQPLEIADKSGLTKKRRKASGGSGPDDDGKDRLL